MSEATKIIHLLFKSIFFKPPGNMNEAKREKEKKEEVC